jgi:hypothetical protein
MLNPVNDSYAPEPDSLEQYVSKNNSTPKSPNSSRSVGEKVGPPLKLEVKCPQNRDTLNRCWYSRRAA